MLYQFEMLEAKVKIFQFPSNEESIVVTATQKTEKSAEEISRSLIGKIVNIDWPHIMHAR